MAITSPSAADSFHDDGVQAVFPFVASGDCRLPCCSGPSLPPAEHVFKPGDWVVVFQIGFLRRPLIEGLAEIILSIPREPHFYFVRFKGECRPRRRYVLPGLYQTASDAMLESLLSAWRIGTPHEILAEFFPDDLVPDNDNEEV